MNISHHRAELERLDLQRARLLEILTLGIVSPELQSHLRQTLDGVERQMAELQGRPAVPSARKAA